MSAEDALTDYGYDRHNPGAGIEIAVAVLERRSSSADVRPLVAPA
jgi:hypothetical protein